MPFILITITYTITYDTRVGTSFLFGFKQVDTSFILAALEINKVSKQFFLLCQRTFYITAESQ